VQIIEARSHELHRHEEVAFALAVAIDLGKTLDSLLLVKSNHVLVKIDSLQVEIDVCFKN
jgi:hypothetical protein